MKPFLETVAEHLYSTHGNDISKLTLVFPNRRASLFFSKYLSKQIAKPIWLPETTTISDLMFSYAGIKPADPLMLNYKLYKAYCQATNSLEPYDEFYFWGNVMLSDFDQIDKYLVDPKKLFTNINDLKEIEQQFNEFDKETIELIEKFLNLVSSEGESLIRSRYSKIWANLYGIYSAFTNSLISEGIAYEGLAYRLAVKALEGGTSAIPNQKFVFIGFNALSKSEQRLLLLLKSGERALFYWDYDNYYINSPTGVDHEAGLFMRQNLKLFPNALSNTNFDFIGNIGSSKKVTLISSPSEVTQTKIVPDILDELNINNTNELTTAVVLPDEKLLLPLLTALPEKYSNANITMEYPLRETSAYSFIDALLTLQKSSDKQTKFYYRDVLLIISHPYIQLACPDEANRIRDIIIDRQLLNIPPDTFSGSDILEQIFKPVTKGSELANYLATCINSIISRLTHEIDANDDKLKFEVEYLLTINRALKRLGLVISEINEEYSNKTFRSYLTKALAEQRVSFIGEPLSGIQIMGFLETRNLDFKNLVILSVNDNLLPGSHFSPSFIVPTLRQAYGLPDYKHQNAVYAYYFYRLMQRAENIYLVYTNITEGLKSGELSRFVKQLQMESNLNIKEVTVNFDLGVNSERPIEVTKNEAIAKRLSKYFETTEGSRYLSPSALSEFKNCSLSFFFDRVLGISAPDELDEELDAMGIGSVFHKAMEQIYSGFVGKEVTKDQIQNRLNQLGLVEETVFRAFKEISKFNGNIDELNGRNRLLLERVNWMVRNALGSDLNRTPYKLLAIEEEVETVIPIELSGKALNVRLGGKIDRLELKNGKLTIVDFKTGKHEPAKTKISNISDFDGKTDKDGLFQQLVYKFIYTQENSLGIGDVDILLWYVRSTDGIPSTEVPDTDEFWEEFISYLKSLIFKIVDDSPSSQTSNIKLCENCSYNVICNRKVM
ncbi:MAG TPA: PD-(D/E)XK nuclease family protein [Tenuifilum sp.]|uniref:PD-(D/E)XK nuclease family protein n=1 Tax=Tenuifilum sp. TaxID=2760880 RepID=UPI002CFA43DE|nr:PD-(D/E)XK nuclease family protein [Tenuifilum sp.]